MDVSDSQNIDLTVKLSMADAMALKELAEQQGIGISEALRRSIGTEIELRKRTAQGAKLRLVEDGQTRDVVFQRSSMAPRLSSKP